jgi:hypothetical protein
VNAAYTSPSLYRRLCGGIVHPSVVNLSLWTSLTIKISWSDELRYSLPTPPSFHPGLYRRICASIVHTRAINRRVWTSLAIKIWWSYGLTCALTAPPPLTANAIYLSRIRPPMPPMHVCKHTLTPRS